MSKKCQSEKTQSLVASLKQSFNCAGCRQVSLSFAPPSVQKEQKPASNFRNQLIIIRPEGTKASLQALAVMKIWMTSYCWHQNSPELPIDTACQGIQPDRILCVMGQETNDEQRKIICDFLATFVDVVNEDSYGEEEIVDNMNWIQCS